MVPWQQATPKRVSLGNADLIQDAPSLATHSDQQPDKEFNESRRSFLKYLAFGGALFATGWYLKPLINMFREDPTIGEQKFQNFMITETEKQLHVADNDGDEILVIDKESF